jgi:hypothetical protein
VARQLAVVFDSTSKKMERETPFKQGTKPKSIGYIRGYPCLPVTTVTTADTMRKLIMKGIKKMRSVSLQGEVIYFDCFLANQITAAGPIQWSCWATDGLVSGRTELHCYADVSRLCLILWYIMTLVPMV